MNTFIFSRSAVRLLLNNRAPTHLDNEHNSFRIFECGFQCFYNAIFFDSATIIFFEPEKVPKLFRTARRSRLAIEYPLIAYCIIAKSGKLSLPESRKLKFKTLRSFENNGNRKRNAHVVWREKIFSSFDSRY